MCSFERVDLDFDRKTTHTFTYSFGWYEGYPYAYFNTLTTKMEILSNNSWHPRLDTSTQTAKRNTKNLKRFCNQIIRMAQNTSCWEHISKHHFNGDFTRRVVSKAMPHQQKESDNNNNNNNNRPLSIFNAWKLWLLTFVKSKRLI